MKKSVKKPQLLMMLAIMLVFFTLAPAAMAEGDGDGNTLKDPVIYHLAADETEIQLDVAGNEDFEFNACDGLMLVGYSGNIVKLGEKKYKVKHNGDGHFWVKVKGVKTKADATLKQINGVWFVGGTSCDNQNGNSGGNNGGGSTLACPIASLTGPSLKAALMNGNKISVTENGSTGKGAAHLSLPQNCDIDLTLAVYVKGNVDGKYVLFDSNKVKAKGDVDIQVNLPQNAPYQLVLLKGQAAAEFTGQLPANVVLDSKGNAGLGINANLASLKLDNLCIPEADSFQVTNTNNFAVPFTWKVDGSNQTGSGTVNANSTVNLDTNVTGLATAGKVQLYVNGVLQTAYTGNVNACGGSTGSGTTNNGSTGGTTASDTTGTTPGYTVIVIPDNTNNGTAPDILSALENATVTPYQEPVSPDILAVLENAAVSPYQETLVPNVAPGTDNGLTLADNTAVLPSSDTLTASDNTSVLPSSGSLTAADTTSQAPQGMTVLPQTGESLPVAYYMVGLILILLGTLMIRARKTN